VRGVVLGGGWIPPTRGWHTASRNQSDQGSPPGLIVGDGDSCTGGAGGGGVGREFADILCGLVRTRWGGGVLPTRDCHMTTTILLLPGNAVVPTQMLKEGGRLN
jgi:hypothetical protein